MAVTKSKSNSSALHALTAAALLLPGLLQAPDCFADDGEVDFEYGHYQEGHRQLYGAQSKFDPIEVESLHGGIKLTLADRVKLAFNYTQDTWTGATPVTTAPLAFGTNNPILTSTWVAKKRITIVTGASPLIQPSGDIFVDRKLNPINYNPSAKTNKQRYGAANTQLVHTMSMASPETRQQGDFKLGYEWDEVALDVGGGISVERDYESRFVNLGSRWDFNQKQTTVSLGASYTNSSTFARLDHDASPYIEQNTFFKNNVKVDPKTGSTLTGQKQDFATHLGLTQVLNKSALLDLGFDYTRSSGYMANPYKVVEVLFVAPYQHMGPGKDPSLPINVFAGELHAFLEQRPELRNQFNFSTRFVQHVDWLDAALHMGYSFSHDDWGINSHTFDLEWGQPVGDSWMVTPRVRYYSQDAADFYAPYLVSNQAYNRVVYKKNGTPFINPDGSVKTVPYNPNKLPSYFSSDARLSGYGALSGGVTVSKKFAKGVTLEAGFEYYTHKGAFKLGGGGEADYADFHYYTVNAALKVNLATLANLRSSEHNEHTGHEGHSAHSHHGSHAPAGVMFDHTLSKAGEVMVGYRYMYNTQAGNTLQGTNLADDTGIRKIGCGIKKKEYCTITALNHTMQMHMLDLMYAPTDWMTLMLMPQFMSMDMNFRQLSGVPINQTNVHAGHEHTTGGIGDTSVYALVKLFDEPEHHLHAGIGFSAPTGNVGIKLRPTHQKDPGFIHYGMQLGSGTWDLKPSLTYTGQMDDWSWGAQASGTKRLEKSNKSGFAYGDIFQATMWGGYNIFDWLSTSVRGVYTLQGSVKGEYNKPHDKASPLDYPDNYGGQYWDVGFGLNAMVTGGEFMGNHLSFEWLQPISDNVNGYQLERESALSLAWGYAF